MKKWLVVVLVSVLIGIWWSTRERSRDPEPPQVRSAPQPRAEVQEILVVPPSETASIGRADQIRSALDETLRAQGRTPSERDLERMTDALGRVMAAREKMRALRYQPDEGGALRTLRDQIGEAAAEFEAVAGMPMSELGGDGITAPDDESPVVFETIEEPK